MQNLEEAHAPSVQPSWWQGVLAWARNVKAVYLGLCLLLVAAAIGLLNYGSYGMTGDEEAQRQLGLHVYNYVFSGDTALLSYRDRDYGVAIELPLVIIEKALGLADTEAIYKTRHLFSHWFFLIGAFACFLLVHFLYRSKLLATFGFLLIVLMPIFYGHSFFNSKDLPFASMHLICFYLAAVALSTRKWGHYLLLGVAIGLLINTRIMGILFLAVFLSLGLLDGIVGEGGGTLRKRKALGLGLVLVAAMATLYLTWPFLWKNPIGNFLEAFRNMSHFRWDLENLFQGRYVRATELPWSYVPVWILYTTPIYYLLGGGAGMFCVVVNLASNPRKFLQDGIGLNNVAYLLCFFGPIISVIVFKSVLYDGWRQTYFAYPAFAMLAVYALHLLLHTRARTWIIGLTTLAFGHILYFMVAQHPHQYLYFNELLTTKEPEFIRKHYEFDFWAISYKESLEYILEHDPSPTVDVATSFLTGYAMRFILPPERRDRVHFVKIPEATYLLTTYRWHPSDYKEYQDKSWHKFKLFDNTYSEIFKLK